MEEICVCFKKKSVGSLCPSTESKKPSSDKRKEKRKVNIKTKGISTSGKTVRANLLVPRVASSVLSGMCLKLQLSRRAQVRAVRGWGSASRRAGMLWLPAPCPAQQLPGLWLWAAALGCWQRGSLTAAVISNALIGI